MAQIDPVGFIRIIGVIRGEKLSNNAARMNSQRLITFFRICFAEIA